MDMITLKDAYARLSKLKVNAQPNANKATYSGRIKFFQKIYAGKPLSHPITEKEYEDTLKSARVASAASQYEAAIQSAAAGGRRKHRTRRARSKRSKRAKRSTRRH